jgi:hypothetical protein
MSICSEDKFEELQSWNVPAHDNKTEILYLAVSKDETRIAVALGKNVIKDEYKVTELCIYKKERNGKFEIEKIRDFEFTDASYEFVFSVKKPTELIFVTREELFDVDYTDDAVAKNTMYTFEHPLHHHPELVVFSKTQRQFIVCTKTEVLFVDLDKKNPSDREIDINETEHIDNVMQVMASDTHFFLLANKKNHKLGIYLFAIDIKNPNDKEKVYYLSWNNKLDIGNCDM